MNSVPNLVPVTYEEYRCLEKEWRRYVYNLREEHKDLKSFEDLLDVLLQQKDFRAILFLGNTDSNKKPSAAKALSLCDIPPEVFYYLVLDVYIMSRPEDYRCFDDFIYRLCDYAPADYLRELPVECINKETFTVYRGTTETDINEVGCSYSWTLKKEVAVEFCKRITAYGRIAHLYRATIVKNAILAYTNERDEYEVIQCGDVFDIEELPWKEND